jgi:hypothetical protein
MRLLCLAVFLSVLLLASSPGSAGQSTASGSQASPLPDAPQVPAAPAPPLGPCELRDAGAAVASAAAIRALDAAGVPQPSPPPMKPASCPAYIPVINWYSRFLNGPQVKPLTSKEKGWLAIRNLGDPFNFVTIAGNSAIYIGSDSHTPYGPGIAGLVSNIGVTYSEDATGEFFGTFLIPSIVHQDPHYHRMPNASIPRRILHTILQIVWTQGDNGRNMINYADLVGFAIDDEIANLYVPAEQTDLPATAARYATGLATAPVDNLITEFVPDVASRIHVRIVLVQRIINQVAKTDTGAE